MKKVSYESFTDIIWPIIKEYTSGKDCAYPFDKLQKHFKEKGYALDHQSETDISVLFNDIANILRDGIFDVNMDPARKKQFEKSYEFLEKCTSEMAKVFLIPPVDEKESQQELQKQINKWFEIRNETDKEGSKKAHIFKFKNAQDYLKFLQNPDEKMQEFKGLSPDKIMDEVFYANGDLNSWGPLEKYVINETMPLFDFRDAGEVDEKQVKNLLMFLKNSSYVKKQSQTAFKLRRELRDSSEKAELSTYYENPEFIHKCKELLSTLKKHDLYHGTTHNALQPIMQNGLYMVQKSLDSTTRRMNCFRPFGNVDALLNGFLLYRSGLEGSRGDGMVFIKEDAQVTPVSEEESRSFNAEYSMSGLVDKFRYKIKPEYIIGTIDAVNQQVNFGPAFEKEPSEREQED